MSASLSLQRAQHAFELLLVKFTQITTALRQCRAGATNHLIEPIQHVPQLVGRQTAQIIGHKMRRVAASLSHRPHLMHREAAAHRNHQCGSDPEPLNVNPRRALNGLLAQPLPYLAGGGLDIQPRTCPSTQALCSTYHSVLVHFTISFNRRTAWW